MKDSFVLAESYDGSEALLYQMKQLAQQQWKSSRRAKIKKKVKNKDPKHKKGLPLEQGIMQAKRELVSLQFNWIPLSNKIITCTYYARK